MTQTNTDKSVNELNVWFPDNKVKLTSGTEITLPKLSWGRESKALKIVLQIVNESTVLKELLQKDQFSPELLAFALPQLLEKFADKITDIMFILTGVEKQKIEDDFVTEDILLILGPFFRRLTSVVKGAANKVLVANEEKTPELLQTL